MDENSVCFNPYNISIILCSPVFKHTSERLFLISLFEQRGMVCEECPVFSTVTRLGQIYISILNLNALAAMATYISYNDYQILYI
jgi:hypothetical protein